MLGVPNIIVSIKPTCNTNLWTQVFLDTGENEAACVAGQEEHYNLLLETGCHQLPLSCTGHRVWASQRQRWNKRDLNLSPAIDPPQMPFPRSAWCQGKYRYLCDFSLLDLSLSGTEAASLVLCLLLTELQQV